MKICYIADGKSIHTQRWINYFAQRGHEVHLISYRFPTNCDGFDARVQIHPLVVLFPRAWKVLRYFSGSLRPLQVRRMVNKIKPDIVDGHYITVYGFLAACSGFHPLILSAWGSDVLIAPKQSRIHRLLTEYSLRKADLIICDSETVKTGLVELGANSRKIKKVFWGVDTQQFSPQHHSQELRGKLGTYGVPTVVSIRNLRPIYNVGMLIRAVPLVLKQMPETKFMIAGDGQQRDALTNLADLLGVSNSIRFVGWISHDELPKYLASSDVYVSTSLSDSTSLSLQEAMACELAPVVTDLPANREWVTDAENGFIVPANDAQALADKIVYLIKNRGIREEFGKQGRKIIKEKAEYQKEMAKMEKIYQGLTSKIA